MRRIRRIGAVLVLAASGALLAASPASAATVPPAAPAAAPADQQPWWHPKEGSSTCATPPDVDAPVVGAVGGATPDQVQGNDVSMWQDYGDAGMRWWTYDLGWSGGDGAIGGGIGVCLPDGAALGAASQTMIGNFFFQGVKNILSLDDMLLRRAYTSDWLDTFDPFAVRAVTSLHDSLFTKWSYVALGLLGLLVLMKAYKGSLTNAVTRAVSAAIVFTAVYLIFTQPLFIKHTFEQQLDAGTGMIASSISGQTATDGSHPAPADAMIGALHEVMAYRVWLEGVFGDADSATAQKYGPRILADTAMTKAEVATRGTPQFAKLVEQKQSDFVKAAKEIKDADPVAYTYFQGKHSEDRGSKAMRATIAAGGASPVIVFGAGAMMVSKLLALFALATSMVYLVVAIVRGDFGVAQLDRVLAGAATALAWSVALPISMLLNDAALNNPKLDPISSAIIIIVLNVVIFFSTLAIAPGFSGLIRRKHANKGMKYGKAFLQFAAGFMGARQGAAPPYQPRHGAGDAVDAEVLPDTGGRHRAPVYAEDWTREPIASAGTPARALPVAPVSPHDEDIETPAERDARTLPPEPRHAPEPERQSGPEEYRPTHAEGGSTVYDIYSGRPAPDAEAPARDDEPVVGEVGEGDGPLALEGSGDSWSNGGRE